MSGGHKAGIDYGIDHGLVAVLLIWIALTVALIVLFVLSGHAQEFLHKLPAEFGAVRKPLISWC